jgi:uncharacterized protein
MPDNPECNYILQLLKDDLSQHLQYHTLAHTLDVCRQAAYIAAEEGVAGHDLKLLLVAAAYHDAGYLQQRKDHEDLSCKMVQEILPGFGYPDNDIVTICGIIMATKLPQSPKTLLEEIICDADLDYLGRDDFFTTGDGLYHELLQAGIVANVNEWNRLQVDFLENHHYFTVSAKRRRTAKKQENLNILHTKITR